MLYFKGMIKSGFKIVVFVAVLLVCLKGRAQLSIGNDGIFIKNGTDFSIDSMMLVLAVDVAFNNLIIKKQDIPVALPNNVGFHYSFSSPVSFSGKIGILLPDAPETAAIAFAAEKFGAEDFYVLKEKAIENNYLVYVVNNISLEVLTAVKPAVLPVNLIQYVAKAANNFVRLEWITATKQDNKEYLISRSADGIFFTELGRVPGKGSTSARSTYHFHDINPLNGSNYYKLEQIDYKGKVKELGIRFLAFSFPDSIFTLYPNPTPNRITVHFGDKKVTAISLNDLNGHILQQVPVKARDSTATLSLEDYPAGMYIVTLTCKNSIEIKKVIKL